MLAIAIIVSSCLFAGGYYFLRRKQIEKKLRSLQSNVSIENQLDALKAQLESADLAQQKLGIEVQEELAKQQASFTENPFVRVQKKKHKQFRHNQTSHSDEEVDK